MKPIYFKKFYLYMIYKFFNLMLILLIGIFAGIVGSITGLGGYMNLLFTF